MWRATSRSVLNSFSGMYAIKLMPCFAKSNERSYKFPLECDPKSVVSYLMPIRMERAFGPVSTKYSLDTLFALSNSPPVRNPNKLLSNRENGYYDGYFRKGKLQCGFSGKVKETGEVHGRDKG